MICPRCEKDTTLWIQKITQDRRNPKTREVTKQGQEVFLCNPCKSDWMSISSSFARYWWKVMKPFSAREPQFEGLYEIFLKDNDRYGKADRRKLAQVAVGILSGMELTKRACVFIPDVDLVTKEDFSWAAGVIDACGSIKKVDPDYPRKLGIVARHPSMALLERLKDLVGGRVQTKIKPQSFNVTHENAKWALQRMEPYFHCSREHHPEEVSNDDRTLAWATGYWEAAQKEGKLSTECKWVATIFSILFGGGFVEEGKTYVWVPVDRMVFRRKISVFTSRKVDPAGARDPNAGKTEGGRLPMGRGEDRAPGIPKGSRPERPPAPEPNARAGSTPAGEGDRTDASQPEPNPRSVRVDSKVELEVELSEKTIGKLKARVGKCFLCKWIVEDLGKTNILKGAKRQPFKAKLNHLWVDFAINPKATCPVCEEEVALRHFLDDLSVCSICSKQKKVLIEEDKDTKGVPA